MKLSQWAKANGLAYQTAWRLAPVARRQTAYSFRTTPDTATVIVYPPKAPTVESVALSARVLSADEKALLERQLECWRNMRPESV